MTPEGLALLKKEEALRTNVYKDSAGYPTIGYGTKLPLSEDECDWLLEHRADEVAKSVLGLLPGVSLSPHQVDALVSFVYNVGITGFEDSTLLKKIKAGDFTAVPGELRRWIHAGGRIVPGLLARRNAEIALWQS